MKLAILLLTHKNPAQVQRLIKKLAHPSIRIFLHADKKAGWNKEIFPVETPFIENNIQVYWGDFSPVQATLNGMKEIRQCPYEFDYFILLSGQDYLIKSIDALLHFLEANKGKEFIEHTPVSKEGWSDAMSRYQYYHYRKNKNKTGWFFYTMVRIFMKLAGLKRKPPMPVWGGSQWFTITKEAFDYILSYTEGHPEYISFMKKSNFTDELFFQTILMNSPYKDNCVDDNLRYINWDTQSGKKVSSPKTLTLADYEQLQKSPAFFARKFDADIDSDILDKIDTTLL